MRIPFRELKSAMVFGPMADLLHNAATLKELTQTNPAAYNGKPCTATFVAMNKNGGKFHVTYRVFGEQKGSDPRGHLVKFRFYPDATITDPMQLDVEVSCDCYAFVYYGPQHNLENKDALERDVPGRDGLVDKSPPDLANYPHHTYVICKHIKAAAGRVGEMIQRHMKKHKEDTEFEDKQYQKSLTKVQQKQTRPIPATPAAPVTPPAEEPEQTL